MRRAYLVWLIGALAYCVAVLQRSSFGVAGLAAADRFDSPASIVATFVIVQLFTYSLMQVPAGLLCDRFGSRTVICCGAILMALGQCLLAAATTVPAAILARTLVGTGDAMTFSSVLALVPAWFPAQRFPLLSQLTGIIGQSGQVLSAVPLALLLADRGWTVAFLAAAATALASAVLVAALVRDRPPGVVRTQSRQRTPIREQVRAVGGSPGTQLGFWVHWITGSAPLMFAMMWGYPYLVRAEGLSSALAGTLLSVLVVAGVVIGPTLGILTQRFPLRRSDLAITVAACTTLPWIAVLLWPGRAPLWLLVVWMVGLAAGGPGTSLAFDLARTFNPLHRIGTATGVVIMGGFIGAILSTWLVGLTIDRLGGAYTLRSFRLAMGWQVLVIVVGVAGVYESRRRARRVLAAEGTIVPPWRDVLGQAWRRRRR